MIIVVNVADVLDALQKARRAVLPGSSKEMETFLSALYVDAIEPLREWIFSLECAVDEVERTAEQLLDAVARDQPQLREDLICCVGCTLDELDIVRATRP